MTDLAEADRVDIHILVDNAVDGLSSTPLNVEGEWAFATRRGLRASSDRCAPRSRRAKGPACA